MVFCGKRNHGHAAVVLCDAYRFKSLTSLPRWCTTAAARPDTGHHQVVVDVLVVPR